MKIQFPSGFAIFLSDTEADHITITEAEISITDARGRKRTIVAPSCLIKDRKDEMTPGNSWRSQNTRRTIPETDNTGSSSTEPSEEQTKTQLLAAEKCQDERKKVEHKKESDNQLPQGSSVPKGENSHTETKNDDADPKPKVEDLGKKTQDALEQLRKDLDDLERISGILEHRSLVAEEVENIMNDYHDIKNASIASLAAIGEDDSRFEILAWMFSELSVVELRLQTNEGITGMLKKAAALIGLMGKS